jgi:ribosomal 50S subunit-recycling heat shock protein
MRFLLPIGAFEGILKISRLTTKSNKKEGGDTMKNMIKVLVVALTTLSFSALGFAQAKPATPATPATPAAPAAEKKTEMKSEKAKTHRVTGEVTSLDAKAGSFAVKENDKEIKLTADSKGAKDSLEKVKVGDMVRVSYTEKDGKMIASSVKAQTKKAPEKKADVTEKKPATK